MRANSRELSPGGTFSQVRRASNEGFARANGYDVMGGWFSTANEASTVHEDGYFYNLRLNNSTIKELHTLRTTLQTTFADRGDLQQKIDDELAPLYAEIEKREAMDIVQ